mgnify:CR=1 FL=1|jgi:hypothetical protein
MVARCASWFLIDPVKSFSLLLTALAVAAVSCQRIPPAESIPGYGEKKAAEEKAESKPFGATENPPQFFPSPGRE